MICLWQCLSYMTEYLNICIYTHTILYHVCFAACVPYTRNTFHDSLVPLKNGPHWGGVFDRWSTLHWERWTETHLIQRLGRLEDAWQWRVWGAMSSQYTSMVFWWNLPVITRFDLVNFLYAPFVKNGLSSGLTVFFGGDGGGPSQSASWGTWIFLRKAPKEATWKPSGTNGGRIGSVDDDMIIQLPIKVRKIGLQQIKCFGAWHQQHSRYLRLFSLGFSFNSGLSLHETWVNDIDIHWSHELPQRNMTCMSPIRFHLSNTHI